MVYLSPRFAVLAALCSIATFSLTSPVDAAALHARSGSLSPGISGPRVDARSDIPVIPPPHGSSGKKHPKSKNHDKSRGFPHSEPYKHEKAHNERRYYDFHPLLRFDRPFFGGFGRREAPDLLMEGVDNSVSVGRQGWHTGPDGGKVVNVVGNDKRVEIPRAPHHHHHHHHGEHDTVIIHGNDDHVNIHSRSPHHHHGEHDKVIIHGNHDAVNIHSRGPHHHHDHHHGEHDTVIVHGNHDHVNVHSRSPHHHHHHHHHGEHDKVIIHGNDDTVNIHSREPRHHHHQHHHHHSRSSVIISNDAGASYIVKGKRGLTQQLFAIPALEKSGSSLTKRDGIIGVPGRIDIMSPVSDPSSPGQRIASLVLAQNNMTDSSDPSTTTSESSTNLFVLNASPDSQTQIFLSRLPPTSAEMDAASTTPSSEVRVMLQLPIFNAASASTETWCATFDPAPPAPAPLTAQPCFPMEVNGVDGPHNSQVFSYNTVSGAVQPMWFDMANGGTISGSEATDSAAIDPATPNDAAVASVTDFGSPARRDDTQALGSSAESSMVSTTSTSSSTAPSATPDTPNGSSNPSNSTASGASPAAAQDVMLVFTPDESVLPAASPAAQAAAAMDMQAPIAASTVTTTTYATYWETVTVTPTLSASVTEDFAPTSVPSSTTSSAAFTSIGSSSPSSAATSTSIEAAGISATPTPTDPALSTTAGAPSTSNSAPSTADPVLASSTDTAASPSSTVSSTDSAATPAPTPVSYGEMGVQVVPAATPVDSLAAPAATPSAPSPNDDGDDTPAPLPTNSVSASTPANAAPASGSPDVNSSTTDSTSPAPTDARSTPTSAITNAAANPSMTPYSTEPYTWMFKRDTNL
ncbi:hypothetical protein K488DRAFT_83984 [Vararia minispora EC-137]|uniref:Uncharacterized protein n=1 Tax=Vararia minispora EC-137 TaxID=1314806 RepID=A0ACB8QS04_9AGAM|nr:hypothetical protein K488DRAFT_83984 [Vararia minispora EC-137]